MNAPILLFVFNRPDHVRRTVEALQRNTLAAESILYIYSDAARTPEQQDAVGEVRRYIHTIATRRSGRSEKIHTHHRRIQGNKHH